MGRTKSASVDEKLRGEVLFVDDDAKFLKDWRGLIADSFPGVHFHSAKGPKEARSVAETHAIQVAVTDMRFSAHTDNAGYEILFTIRNTKPGTQVIVLTQYPEWQNSVRCLRAGCFDYLNKSSAPEIILNRIEEAIYFANSRRWRESSLESIIQTNWEMVLTESDLKKKGTYLEDLMFHLLSSVPGWQNATRNIRNSSEQFDVVVPNESTDVAWREYGGYIVVECKNQSSEKPDRLQFDALAGKIRRRVPKCLGILVSVNGVTSGFKQAARLEKDFVVIDMDKDAIWQLIVAKDRSEWLKRRVEAQVFHVSR